MKEFEKSSDGESVVLAVPYAEVYIPHEIYNDSPDKGGNSVAYAYGDGVRSIGVFNIRFYDVEEPESRNSTPLRVFNYPNEITMFPTDKEIVTTRLSDEMDEDKYIVFEFYKGDIIMSSKIQQNSKNCEHFMNFLISGKLPKGLGYDDLYFAWVKNFDINGQNPGVPAATMQMIISENCRSKSDPMKQFRKVVENDGVGKTDYVVNNMMDICSNGSVFNALSTGWYYKSMMVSALNMSHDGVKQNTTPLEKIMYI